MGVIFSFATVVLAVDQFKSTEVFVGDSDTPITSQTDRSFSLYIGENISGISSPVKSAYFIISGVYTATGSATLNLTINSDGNSSRTFVLPNVGTTPTPFEILYKDETGLINPSTPGTYNYTLSITPSNMSLYGLSAKLVTTYSYTPPGVCADGASANEKVKTIENFVGNSESAITSQADSQFSIYVGNNISGVSSPIKSAYFVVSGIYTSSGSPAINFKINSDAGSSQTFSLPDVGTTPTPFEIVYKDATGIISPVTSGEYAYTLSATPSGATIYGLGEKLVLTYQYKPNCTAGWPATGELTSAVFDSTASADGPAFNSIMWKGNLGGPLQDQGKVRFQVAASDSSSGPWSYIGSDGVSCGTNYWYDPGAPNTPIELKCPSYFNNHRYFKYKVQLCSASDCVSAGNYTPTVTDVVLNWAP